jgi:ferritin-like metal-binding protein YciE
MRWLALPTKNDLLPDSGHDRSPQGDKMALKEVLLDELRDMYSAENQLVKALPKLAKGAKDKQLKQLFKEHLEETKGQVLRLRQVFELLGEKPTGQHCNGMQGVIAEGSEALEKELQGASFDAGLIGAAMRTEHYEIAGYSAAIGMARTLGEREIVTLLSENLAEEVTAAKNITALSKPIMKQAAAEPEQEKGSKSLKEKYSALKSRQDKKEAAPDIKGGKKATAAKSTFFGELLDTITGGHDPAK